MRFLLALALVTIVSSTACADAMDEVNEWRKRNGLRPFVEDPAMTKFAKMKALYRAERNLRDGHQGPRAPAGWHEGTGEAQSHWGWLTCESESDFRYAGAGMVMGRDGTRFMVLVCRDGSGRALLPRNNAPVHSTAYLTPNPILVGSKAAAEIHAAQKSPGVTTASGTAKASSSGQVVPAVSTQKASTTKATVPSKPTTTASSKSGTSQPQTAAKVCPHCGKVHR